MPKIPAALAQKITSIAKADPRDFLQIEIGDTKQTKFLPQLKIMRWDNEVNLSVRLLHNEKSPVVENEAGKTKWIGEKIEAHFYDLPVSEDHPEGGSEFEVILKEKPASNKIEFSLNTKGLDFFYQPPLTEEKFKDDQTADETHIYDKDKNIIAERPDNVVGSYAIYASDKKMNLVGGKKYRTGKVCQIFRPKIIDSAGVKVFGRMKIEKKILSVEIPQDFLDNAVYPIKHAAGATFGFTTAASTYIVLDQSTSNVSYTCGDTFLGAAGTGISMTCKARAGLGSIDIQMALYKSDFSYLANGKTGSVTGSTTAQEWTANFVSAPTIAAEQYYLVFNILPGYLPGGYRIYYDTGATNHVQHMHDTHGTWTNPISLTEFSAVHYKFYIFVTYTPVVTSSIKKAAGVAQASIKKVSGVAIASVKKLAGVANT